MLVSIAICTWNRSKLLDQTLSHMKRIRVPEGVGWELLVVNNNSTDDTDAVIARHSAHLPIRRLFESKQGHSNARNCAIAAAQGSLIIWTDDDVLVDAGWLSAYVCAAAKWPNATYFGGAAEPWFEETPPTWVDTNLRNLQGPFALCQPGDEDRPVRDGEVPVGANMAFRTASLRRFSFDPNLGRVAGNLISGDETDVIERFQRSGHQGVWVPGAKVVHYIPKERLTLRYIWNWYYGGGRTAFRHEGVPPGCNCLGSVPRYIVKRAVVSWLSCWLFAPVKGPRWFKAFRLRAYSAGYIRECRAHKGTKPNPAAA